MTRETQTLQDDIAYLRGLAEDGRDAPLLAGPVLVAAAVIFGAATLGQWALAVDLVALSPWAPLWLWVGAGALFAVTLSLIIKQMKTRLGIEGQTNRTVGAAWTA
ncbi:hypothetical protein LTR94_029119, partial [Friedmanniomyces endolithicus]